MPFLKISLRQLGGSLGKRKYEAAFIAKLSDSEAEAAETQVHLEFAERCAFIAQEEFTELDSRYEHILSQLSLMASSPAKWCLPR